MGAAPIKQKKKKMGSKKKIKNMGNAHYFEFLFLGAQDTYIPKGLSTGPRRETVRQQATKKEIKNYQKKVDQKIEIIFNFI